jgi:hypothetical protein
MRDEVEEQLDHLATQRLQRRAAKHPTVVIPRITMRGEYHQDENWEHGHATGIWYLKRAAVAAVLRDIEEAERRRREVWEVRLRRASTIFPWLIAILSSVVSLLLAWPRKGN